MALRGSHTGARCKRENELNSITDRLLEPGPESLAERLENLRAIAMEHLAKLRKLVPTRKVLSRRGLFSPSISELSNWNR